MTTEDEQYSSTNICRFCEKEIYSDKVKDKCHLTGKFRGPAHKCIINVTQKQSSFFLFVFYIFSNFDCHLFVKKLVDKKKDLV